IGLIDGNVAHLSGRRKNRPGRRSQGAETGPTHLQPPQPAIVKPPVVMMRNQGDALPNTDARQLAREQKVAADAEVVRPDETIFRRRSGEDFCERSANELSHGARGATLFEREPLPPCTDSAGPM